MTAADSRPLIADRFEEGADDDEEGDTSEQGAIDSDPAGHGAERLRAGHAAADQPQAPTVEPTKAPTATPAPPTATPLPLPPARLLLRSPAPGEEQPVDAPIEVTFDEPMDQASVEAAFAISPTVQGTFNWTDERTLAFTPAKSLERGTRYQVTIAATARNAEGLPLDEPIAFDFSTTGLLEVSQVQPTPGADELDPDTLVTVVFNRPVVSLASISQQAALPTPLTFMPPVRGEGEWLNTSIYVFRPAEGLLPATRVPGPHRGRPDRHDRQRPGGGLRLDL